jgi:hypothetical protein
MHHELFGEVPESVTTSGRLRAAPASRPLSKSSMFKHVHLWDYGANKSFSDTRKRSVPLQRPWTMSPRRKDSRAGRTDASRTAFPLSEHTSTNDGARDATHRSADQAADDDEARCEGGQFSNQ